MVPYLGECVPVSCRPCLAHGGGHTFSADQDGPVGHSILKFQQVYLHKEGDNYHPPQGAVSESMLIPGLPTEAGNPGEHEDGQPEDAKPKPLSRLTLLKFRPSPSPERPKKIQERRGIRYCLGWHRCILIAFWLVKLRPAGFHLPRRCLELFG